MWGVGKGRKLFEERKRKASGGTGRKPAKIKGGVTGGGEKTVNKQKTKKEGRIIKRIEKKDRTHQHGE